MDDNDLNNDGVPDLAEGFSSSASAPANLALPITAKAFSPLDLTLPAHAAPDAEFKLLYDESDPSGVTVTGSGNDLVVHLPAGHLRVWTKDGDEVRNPADFSAGGDVIETGEAYRYSDFMTTNFTSIRLYVEAVRGSQTYGDQEIQLEAGQGEENVPMDAVRLTALTTTVSPSSAGGINAAGAEWSGPVLLKNGAVSVGSNPDLELDGWGTALTQSRTWTNQLGMDLNTTSGKGFSIAEFPQIISMGVAPITPIFDGYSEGTNQLPGSLFVSNGTTGQWFDSSNGALIARDNDTLSASATPNFFYGTQYSGNLTIQDSSGDVTQYPVFPEMSTGSSVYYDPATDKKLSIPTDLFSPENDRATASGPYGTNYYNSNYSYTKTGAVSNSFQSGSNTFSYSQDGSTGRINKIVATIQDQPLGTRITRQVEYSYYAANSTYGNAGDLQSATIEDAAGNPLQTYYYRYYTTDSVSGGYKDGLEDVFTPTAFARLKGAVSDPLTADEAKAQAYATYHFTYDSLHRAATVTALGQGTTSYTYTEATDSLGPNAWTYKTTITNPTGTKDTVYTNYLGEVMVDALKDSNGHQWATYYRYDTQGRVIYQANPSAFVSAKNDNNGAILDESAPGLVSDGNGGFPYLHSDSGLITTVQYYTSTTATGTPGGVNGWFKSASIQDGTAGTPILQRKSDYVEIDDGDYVTNTPLILYRLANATVYRNTDGSGAETTHYDYIYNGSIYNGGDLIEMDVTAPPVTDSDANQVTKILYDGYGRPQWTQDADGYINYIQYDGLTGAVSKTIADVSAKIARGGSLTGSGAPADWRPPANGGLNLITTTTVDVLGRPLTVTDPMGHVTTYSYLDSLAETKTTITPPVGPVQIVANDLLDGWSDTLTVAAGVVESLTRSQLDAAGRVIAIDRYSSVANLSVNPSGSVPSGGDPVVPRRGRYGDNFSEAKYQYDDFGRLAATISANGTFYSTGYDDLSRRTSLSVGVATHDSTGHSALTNVESWQYDNGGVGDGNPTADLKYTNVADDANPVHETDMAYDWRDRLVETKVGVEATEDSNTNRPLTYVRLDNLGEATATYIFDGDGVPIVGSDNTSLMPSLSLLRSLTWTRYDDQGRTSQTSVFSIDPSDGASSDPLANESDDEDIAELLAVKTKFFYDGRGDTVATEQPGGLWTKTVFDGAARPTTQYVTDGSGQDSYHATGDIVLNQTAYDYDPDGKVKFETDSARDHDATATGPLNTADARVTYLATFYDAAERVLRSVNFGTNGGSPPSSAMRASVTPPPALSFAANPQAVQAEMMAARPKPSDGFDTMLITDDAYNEAGEVRETVDPRGIVDTINYDMLGQVIETVQGNTGSGGAADTVNKTTLFRYDNLGHVRQTIDVTLHGEQVTRYGYGTLPRYYSESPPGYATTFSTSDLLTTTINSDGSTLSYRYNGLGELIAKKSNGVWHAYSYDAVGRQTKDLAIELTPSGDGLGISLVSQRGAIETAYDTLGNTVSTITRNGAVGNIQTQDKRSYNSFG